MHNNGRLGGGALVHTVGNVAVDPFDQRQTVLCVVRNAVVGPRQKVKVTLASPNISSEFAD